jgi:hypothetical protein
MAISISGWARCFILDILLGSIQQHVFSKFCRWENTVRPYTSRFPTSPIDTKFDSRLQHYHVGPRPLVFRRRGKLLRRTSHPLLPRRV